MKQLSIGLLIGAVGSGLLTYSLLKPASDQKKGATDRSSALFLNEKKNKGAHSGGGVHTARGSASASLSGSGALSRYADYSSAENTRGQLALANDVFKLNADQVQELLKSPQVSSMSYFDQSGMILINAAFARLTELSPEKAQEALKEFKGHLKNVAGVALYKEWGFQDPEKALLAAQAETDPMMKKSALVGVLGELARTEPQRAFDIAQESKNQQAYYSIITQWAKTDPATAFEKSKAVGQQAQWLRQSILTQWSISDPEAALNFANALDNTADRSSALSGIITAKIQSDHEKAFEMLTQYEDALPDENLYGVTYMLAEKDPERTLKWLESRPKNDSKSRLLGSVIERWMANDESAAMAYYNGIEDLSLKSKIGKSILQKLNYSDPKKFLKLYKSIDIKKREGDWMYKNAITQLAKNDKDAAHSHVESLSDPAERKIAIEGLMEGLAKDDPEAALETAELISDPVERNAALGHVYDQMADKNPAAVAELFLSQGLTKVGDYDLGDIVYDYARKDLSGAKDFVEKIDDPILRDRAVGKLLYKWSDEDPLAALNYAKEQNPTEGVEGAMRYIGRHLAEKDPKAGLQKVLEYEKGTFRNKLINSFFDEWAENDLEAATKALPALKKTAPKQSHHNIYSDIGREFAEQPDKAVQWISSIKNAKDQYSATQSFVSSWAKDYPNEAAEWTNGIKDNHQRDQLCLGMGQFVNE